MQPDDSQFVFIGNNPAVDFTNTEIVVRGELRDLLQRDADLVHWVQQAGFNLGSRLNPGDLSAARELRTALKAVFTARIDGQSAGKKALAVINRHLAHHCTREILLASGDGVRFELAPSVKALSVSALLASLAHEGARLLASPQAEQLRHCGNPDCILLFVDISRSHRRRWCSMDTCGNRAKVAKHYRSHISR
jgi:predicted RNA-binding Zn ribbon-like protein